MTPSLKTLAKQNESSHFEMEIKERLPSFIQAPAHLNCTIRVEKTAHYYHLMLGVKGLIHVICQRCLHEFDYPFNQNNDIALCADEDTAEKMMTKMDSIVHLKDELDIVSIVTDELHLYCPEKHLDLNECEAHLL
ncbi:MAG TPA: YceD family protein [Legionellaceae bacterium]|nr:YceD family protein [Legionellaceae bacterium]